MQTLTEEKRKELREIKDCCKVDVGEFKDRYSKLNKFDKIVIYLSVVDEDYEFEEDESIDLEKNKEVIGFLKTDKETSGELMKIIRGNSDLEYGDIELKKRN